MSNRIPIRKTYKLYIGGAFPRSESGRSFRGMWANPLASRASRKDLRDSVVAARSALPDWSSRPAANRGQILYRIAEILEHRSTEMERELRHSGRSASSARREVRASVDRWVWYAGWADKLSHLFGAVNSVATSHFSFSVPEPTGIVGVIGPDAPALLGMISLVAPAIVSGNTVVAISSSTEPLSAVTFAEIIATSDVPAGVVNILTGLRAELAPHLARHVEVNALVDASGDAALGRRLGEEAASSVKRVAVRHLEPRQWYTAVAEDPWWMLDTLEIKTTWHPIGW